MSKVRLREQTQDDGAAAPAAQSISLRPLRVSGIVITKAELVEALRAYVPALGDVQVTEDGQHFWLMLGEGGDDANSTAS